MCSERFEVLFKVSMPLNKSNRPPEPWVSGHRVSITPTTCSLANLLEVRRQTFRFGRNSFQNLPSLTDQKFQNLTFLKITDNMGDRLIKMKRLFEKIPAEKIPFGNGDCQDFPLLISSTVNPVSWWDDASDLGAANKWSTVVQNCCISFFATYQLLNRF